MSKEASGAKVLDFKARSKDISENERKAGQQAAAHEVSDFVDGLLEGRVSMEELREEASRLLGEIELLRQDGRWEEILELCYPLDEKHRHLVDAGFDDGLVEAVVFALTQLKRFDEALDYAKKLAAERPDDFRLNAQVAYVAYASLQAARNREVILTPEIKRKRVELVHRYLSICEQLRPDGVTSYYRRGMLFKSVQNKPKKAQACFEKAVKNWEAYSEEKRRQRHQERKNYIKALYQLALCIMEEEPSRALAMIKTCIQADETTAYLENVHKYYTLGKIYRQMGAYEMAKNALERASVEGDPGVHAHVFSLLAECYLDLKDPQKAAETIHRIPRKARKPYILRVLAKAYQAQGNVDKAVETLTHAAEVDRRGKHKALIALARLEMSRGEFNRALRYLENANRFFRDTYGNPCHDALFWKAVTLVKLDELDAAQTTASELHRFNPRYPGLKKLLHVIRQLSKARRR